MDNAQRETVALGKQRGRTLTRKKFVDLWPSVSASHKEACPKKQIEHLEIEAHTLCDKAMACWKPPYFSAWTHFQGRPAQDIEAQVEHTHGSQKRSQDPPCTLKLDHMVPNSGYLGPNRG